MHEPPERGRTIAAMSDTNAMRTSSHLPRDSGALILGGVISGIIGKAFDLPWLVVGALVAFAVLVGGVWIVIRFVRRLQRRVDALERRIASHDIDLQRIDKGLVFLTKTRARDIGAVQEALTRTMAAIASQSRREIGALKDGLSLVTAAAVPPWLPGAIRHARDEGWTVTAGGSSVQFDHPTQDGISLNFPIGTDGIAVRDELFAHLRYVPENYFARYLSRKQIGGGRAARSPGSRTSLRKLLE